ncbi:MAG: NAD-glutamate dehydrogenase [Methyloligellaceae bacterium]
MVENLIASTELVENITEGLRGAGQNQTELLHFARYFLSELTEEDCAPYEQPTILAILNDAFQFIHKRPPNAHKIRAYDIKTDVDDNSGTNSRTVIEILNDDMPFLVDSIMTELSEQHLTPHLVLHPIIHTTRNEHGELNSVLDSEDINFSSPAERPAGYQKESFIHIQIESISDQRKKDVATTISNILESVRLAVADWRAMLLKISDTTASYTEFPPPVEVIKLTESIHFLKWLTDNHFTFLGIREYQLLGGVDNGFLKPVEGSALGILRNKDLQVLKHAGSNRKLTEQMRKFLFSEEPLMVTKANIRSTIHRRVHLDYIGVKTYDHSGEITGELAIVGLFTSVAYTRPPKDIPFIRHKVETAMRRYGLARSSHGSKALQNILDTFPRDELFQIQPEQLYETATGIASLELKPRPRVFIRIDDFKRYASILVFVPRDCFSTETRQAVGNFLAKAFQGRITAYFPFFLESPMVRIHFIIGLTDGELPEFDGVEIEKQVADILRSWRDELKTELSRQFLPSKAGNLLYKFGSAFPAGYEELTPPTKAIQDIHRLEQLNENHPIAINFYQNPDAPDDEVCASIYHLGGSIPLSKRVPVLENLGFAVIDERTFKVTPQIDDRPNEVANLHDMVLRAKADTEIDWEKSRLRLEEGFLAVWDGRAENDVYNNLLSVIEKDWREISVIRAMGSYLRQLGAPFTRAYLGQTLVRHHDITKNLLELFNLRCNPELDLNLSDRSKAQEELVEQIEKALIEIPSLDEDRIVRLFMNLITSVLRTNFYQEKESGNGSGAISFKFDSKNIEIAPNPKPYAEIYVYSPRVEGVHLRGGKIARGGLRWSDRQQDFRTEVLGLAKAQQVKNTVIVPSGAKGGFVAKNLTDEASREERLAEGIECYKIFISSLLSVTDNLEGQKVAHPENVVCYDGEDPYLVVAADKGTATFSDTANKISQDHKFWLDDAFASGGSAGYDHKKMGITARGAWESVKRHFREMDRDIQNEPFTVIGVGDMSGDVFGNGMILSKSTKLVAAFDHRDIFIDPSPAQERSWLERKRLFEMDRSSWQNYNHELISQGGGIFSRQSKSISLTPEIKELTGLTEDTATPNQLIHALLKSEVDLLWFGGIGTYICAEDERDEEVGDRANDAIRIRASELNVKVVGEGANLGMTHKARITFAMNGGRVNSDAIDNSAGVNSSDLEVNIKIALGERVRAGKMTTEERDALLVKMTDEVAEACLINNYLQSLTISLGERRGLSDLSFQKRLINGLEKEGLLNRKLEYLPTDSEMAIRARNGQALTRPELAVLLAYAKIDLFGKLIQSKVPDDEFLEVELLSYFPKTLVAEAENEIRNHRLRREIIATRLANSIINRGGSTMVVRLRELTRKPVEDIAYAFVAACAVFDLESVYREIDLLDTKVEGHLQLSLYGKMQDLLRSQTTWFLSNIDLSSSLSEIIEHYKRGLETLDQSIEKILSPDQIESLKHERQCLEDKGVQGDVAAYIAGLKYLSSGPDMILVSEKSGYGVELAAQAFTHIDQLFDLEELRARTSLLQHGDYFDRVAISSALQDISQIQGDLAEQVLKINDGQSADLSKWLESKQEAVDSTQQLIADIIRSEELTVAKLTVGVSQLRQLC